MVFCTVLFLFSYLMIKVNFSYKKELPKNIIHQINAVCSHPRIDETYLEGAKRRLKEELGIEAELTEKFHFIYKADVGGNLWEHERDHVFTGNYDGEFTLNKDEVSEIRYISMENLDQEMKEYPENFTPWFKIILEEYKHHL